MSQEKNIHKPQQHTDDDTSAQNPSNSADLQNDTVSQNETRESNDATNNNTETNNKGNQGSNNGSGASLIDTSSEEGRIRKENMDADRDKFQQEHGSNSNNPIDKAKDEAKSIVNDLGKEVTDGDQRQEDKDQKQLEKEGNSVSDPKEMADKVKQKAKNHALMKLLETVKLMMISLMPSLLLKMAKDFLVKIWNKICAWVKSAVKWIGHKLGQFGHWLGNKLPWLKAGVAKLNGWIANGFKLAGKWAHSFAHFLTAHTSLSAATATFLANAGTTVLLAAAPVIGVTTAIQHHISTVQQDVQRKASSLLCNFGEAVESVLDKAATTATDKVVSSTDVATNDNQKKIFETLTKKYGFSGAGAAGVCGNVAVESTGDPNKCEGGMNSDLPPSGWTSGYGLFQFTPPTGFASWLNKKGEKKATVENTIEYAFTKGVDKSIIDTLQQSGKWDDLTHASDPAKASDIWEIYYERPGSISATQSLRQGYAKQAYDKFNGSKISANDSILGSLGGSGSSSDASDNDTTATTNEQADKCNGKTQNQDSSGNAADGTGSIKESSSNGILKWAKDDVPDDVKKYIHDPSKAGLSWGSSNGWCSPSGQCVGFSVSYFHALWKKQNAPTHVSGNGKDIASGFANAMGGKTSGTPHAGAVVSIESGTPVSPAVDGNNYGHTFIVEHVLANGDIIIAEQNMKGFGMKGGSGDDIGQPETWNYGWLSKKTYESWHAQFFTPSKGSPDWGD